MSPSFRIARILGVDVRLHVTFVALVVLLAAWELLPTPRGGSVLLPAFAILFGLAGLHEMGHALVARRLGVEVEDILVLPIVLMVRLRLPERAGTELAVAAAGPAVNLLLAALFLAVGPLVGLPANVLVAWPPGSLASLVFWANLLMGTVNLLPAFPMDGGRIFRALLALRLDYVRATNLAVLAGWFAVLVAGSLALVATGNLVIIAVALFLLYLGKKEEHAAEMRARHREMVRLRAELRASLSTGPDGAPAAVTRFGDFRRLRDPEFRKGFERYRRRLEELRAATGGREGL